MYDLSLRDSLELSVSELSEEYERQLDGIVDHMFISTSYGYDEESLEFLREKFLEIYEALRKNKHYSGIPEISSILSEVYEHNYCLTMQIVQLDIKYRGVCARSYYDDVLNFLGIDSVETKEDLEQVREELSQRWDDDIDCLTEYDTGINEIVVDFLEKLNLAAVFDEEYTSMYCYDIQGDETTYVINDCQNILYKEIYESVMGNFFDNYNTHVDCPILYFTGLNETETEK